MDNIDDPADFEALCRWIQDGCRKKPFDDRHKNPSADRHKNPSGDRHKGRLAADRPFIGIDGEGGGEDEFGRQNYLCLCASDREATDVRTLFNDNRPLTIEECFEFILDLPKDAYIVGFFFNYDATQMLRHLPESRLQRIIHGTAQSGAEAPERASGVKLWTHWKDYAIKYLPGHYLKIARSRAVISAKGFETDETVPGTARTVYECGSVFQQKFVNAINDWGVGTPEEIALVEKFKVLRPDFKTLKPAHLGYCQAECRMLAEMMHKFRDAAFECEAKLAEQGLDIKLWNGNGMGAGYVAARMHQSSGTPRRQRPDHARKGAVNYLPERPAELEDMARRAYVGGRFEISAVGLIGKTIYEYDIRSAYPDGMRKLPCPLHTKWEKVVGDRPRGELYVTEVIFDHPKTNVWNALPIRTKDHRICWPNAGHGWYWSCELEAAEELFGAKVEILSAWKAIRCCDCKPYHWVEPVYDFRKKLDTIIKGQGKPLKLGLNACYGKLAQHSGAAPFRDTLSAGLITALTRTKLLSAVAQAPDMVVMLATDALYSTRKLNLDEGGRLGQWELTLHDTMFIVQPGLYWFPKELNPEGNVRTPKTRGVPKSVVQKHAPEFEERWREHIKSRALYLDELAYFKMMKKLEPDIALETPEPPTCPVITVASPTFVGLKLALARKEKLKLAGRWLKECEGGDCDHQYCGRRDISFDWRPKRDHWQVVGSAIRTMPIVGARDLVSVPYDPEKDAEKLTAVVSNNLIQDALPDKLQILHIEQDDFSTAFDDFPMAGDDEDDGVSDDDE